MHVTMQHLHTVSKCSQKVALQIVELVELI